MTTDKISQRRRGLSGFVCVRNAVDLDYCVVEAISSLIPICDEVVVSDGESGDSTREMIAGIGDSRIRVIDYPWPYPHCDDKFLVKWLNWTRARLYYDHLVTLDADEVLSPESYDQVQDLAKRGESGIFNRLNFWKDAQHLAPLNTVCGDTVARCGPSALYVTSDEPFPAVSPNIREQADLYPNLTIFHYGFLRRPEAFMRKSHEVQNMFMGSVDSRILAMEAAGKKWTERDYFEGSPLRSFSGEHPPVAHKWLIERGYDLK